MDNFLVSDHWVVHPGGRIFARQWSPTESAPPLPPIVLFHDSLGCVDLWRRFPDEICRSTGRMVVAYDRLGFGRSGPRTERPGLDFVAEEAVAYLPTILDQLGIGSFVAMGHSVGGGMAIEAAARDNSRCKALVTIAAQVFAEDRTLQGIEAARVQFRDPREVERLVKYHGDRTRWVLDAWIDNWLDPRFKAWTLEGVLPRVQCPTLAIHGDLDEYGSTVHPTLIGRLSRGPSKVDILDGIGHVPHRQQPDVVSRLISDFLRPPA